VLEAPVPVLRHLRRLVAQDRDHPRDGLLADHPAQARATGVLGRDHDGHLVVEDLDGEILAALAEHLLDLLLEDLAGAVVRIDDVVPHLVLDVHRLADDLEVLDVLLPVFGRLLNSCLLGLRRGRAHVCR
jgi:hypothetical protein